MQGNDTATALEQYRANTDTPPRIERDLSDTMDRLRPNWKRDGGEDQCRWSRAPTASESAYLALTHVPTG